MRFSTMLGACLLLAGCGGDALVEADREVGFYNCADGAACETAGGEAGAWIGAAEAAMADIAEAALACNDGEPFTLRVRIDGDGDPQGLGSAPQLGGDQRVCVGRLVLDHVDLGPFEGGDRVIAYAVGATPAPTHDEVAPGGEPDGPPVLEDEVLPEEEPEATDDEPAEAEATEEAPPEGDEGTDVPDEMIE